MPEPPVTENLDKYFGGPQVGAAEFEALLRDTLAQVIVDKCDEIKPVG